MKLLLIDNYDSFSENVRHLFAALPRVMVTVRRNDEDFLGDVEQFDGIIIGPGPGSPEDEAYFGNCAELIRTTTVPLLGICLGFQGIAAGCGATLKRAVRPMHGKVSKLHIVGDHTLLDGVSDNADVMRYHSLMIDTDRALPADMQILAEVQSSSESSQANGREIMAIAHASRPLYGVQFHPESFATESGRTIAENFVAIVRSRA